MASLKVPLRDKLAKATLSISIQATLSALLVCALLLKLNVANSEAKEFDWDDLGLSLTNSNKVPFNGSNNNLRILVSPQRRATKNYEFEYTNNSQPTSSQGEASYVIPGSSNSYISQPSSQSSHSSAYSALSASLATLKNRLSARGMSLSSLGDSASSSGLYQNPASAFGSTYLSDSQQTNQQGQVPNQAQPTYLSVTNQHDQQSTGGYAATQSQANDNKTIVLAIPAKINFLTEGRSQTVAKQQQQQPQQQPAQNQQLAVIQASGDQQTHRPDYSAKQLSLINGQENVAEPVAHIVGRDTSAPDQDNHQYVIVNSPPVASSEHTSTSGGQPSYPGIYQAGSAQPAALNQAYAIKYVPTYQTTMPQPGHQNLYATSEPGNRYSDVSIDEQYGRYTGCIDTCNSADVRWRKYTISKYKYCCSRSSQYDPQFEQPSSDKLSEASKTADDAYYNYLYRRTRSRRSRRPSNRYNSRYHKQTSAASSTGGEDSSGPDSTTSEMGRSSSGGRYDSPYVKNYKYRQSSYGSTDLHDATSTGNNGKYSSKERAFRRGRSRDFDSTDSHPTYDSQDIEGSYPDQAGRVSGSYGYGSGDESVDTAGRYGSDVRSNDEDDARSTSGYGDDADADLGKNGNITEGSDNLDDASGEKTLDDSEPDTTPGYKHTVNRRKKASGKGRSRKGSNGGKSRRSRKNRLNKQTLDHLSNGQANSTDFEVTTGGDQYHQDMGNTNDDEKQVNKESASTDSEADKEAINFSNKIKAMGLNDSAVMNLSKTTMHLKEILLMLEKKAQLKANESSYPSSTSTPAPLTTTSTTSAYPYSLLGSQFSSNGPIHLPTDYLSTDMSLKSPYRYEPSSLSSSLSLPATYQSLNMDNFSSLPPFTTNQYGLGSKHPNYAIGHHPRKRRTNKHVRYNHHLLLPKTHGLASASALLQHSAFAKNQLLNPSYYSSLQYPYAYARQHYPSTFASYPYKSLGKSVYSSSLNGGPISSKLAAGVAAGSGLYSDESRVHGVSHIDPTSSVASSLGPSTTMRLRSKPFVFQPHVMPIYTRHTILTQPVDKK